MRLFDFLTFRGLAVAMLTVSVALLVIWTRYPDFYSNLFLAVPAIVVLSLIFCTVKRVRLAQRKDLRFWGSIIFHAGMIIGVFIMFLAPLVRFSARITLLEGVQTDFNDREFVQHIDKPFFGATVSGGTMVLRDYKAEYKDGVYPVDYSAHVTLSVLDSDVYKRSDDWIRINGPLDLAGYKFLLETGGYAPLFTLKDSGGNIIFRNHVKLNNITRSEDSFFIKEAGLVVYTRFFPDMHREGNRVGSRSLALNNPAFGLKIARKEDLSKIIYSGVLKVGESASLGDMTIEFSRLKSFSVLYVVKDPLYYWLFAGWGIGLAGLILRYLPPSVFMNRAVTRQGREWL